MKKIIKGFLVFLLAVFLIYAGVASMAWSTNNPCANEMTFFTHLWDALRFKSLPQFQEHAP